MSAVHSKLYSLNWIDGKLNIHSKMHDWYADENIWFGKEVWKATSFQVQLSITSKFKDKLVGEGG